MSEGSEGFERTVDELEAIVASLEDEELDLDQALRLFERGVERVRRAADLLDEAHGRVEELIRGVGGRVDSVELEPDGGRDGEADDR
jgi:exodeoxyribonuclease VII small subunit